MGSKIKDIIRIDNYTLQQSKKAASVYGCSELTALAIFALCEDHTSKNLNDITPDFERSQLKVGGCVYHVHVARRSTSDLKDHYDCAVSTKALRNIRKSPYERLLFLSYCEDDGLLTIAGEITVSRFFRCSTSYSIENPMRNDSGNPVTMHGPVLACHIDDLKLYEGYDIA